MKAFQELDEDTFVSTEELTKEQALEFHQRNCRAIADLEQEAKAFSQWLRDRFGASVTVP